MQYTIWSRQSIGVKPPRRAVTERQPTRSDDRPPGGNSLAINGPIWGCVDMRSSRLPAVETPAEFDFAFQPSIKRE